MKKAYDEVMKLIEWCNLGELGEIACRITDLLEGAEE